MKMSRWMRKMQKVIFSPIGAQTTLNGYVYDVLGCQDPV